MKRLRPSVALLVAGLVAGCSGPQVRTLGNGGGPPAYELRGGSLAELQAEATRLCAHGYQLLRHGQRFARPEPDDNAATQWLQQAGDWLSGMPGNEAQATIVCRA
ncbi:MAG TPA: hypothetical protein PLO41_22490 [Rubrivivax sp.]|nr:hypothetical protein [Rubrivivax sp.]